MPATFCVLLFCYTARHSPVAAGIGMLSNEKRYNVVVEEVHSGDDFVLLVDLGVDGLYKRTRARLSGVDVPNAFRARPDTEAGRLRDEIRRMASSATSCEVSVVKEGRGGWLVELLLHSSAQAEPTNVNDLLRSRGYTYLKGENTHDNP